jgi:hypothetical protein
MSPRMDQLVAARIEELQGQAAPRRAARRVERLGRGRQSRTLRQRVKGRLGSYLVETGQRLQTTSAPHSPFA